MNTTMTSAAALAAYDRAQDEPEILAAAEMMAQALRGKSEPKASTPSAPSDLLSVPTLTIALKRMTGIVERRATIPVLSCVLMESAGGTLTIWATDLDIIYRETLRAPDLPDFRMAVPAGDLAGVIKGAAGAVDIRPQPNGVDMLVSVDGLEVSIPGFPADDFPIMSAPQAKAASATLRTADFLGNLEFVTPSISVEETRYYLNGAYIHLDGKPGEKKLAIVATDGSRLMRAEMDGPRGLPDDTKGAIVPRKSVGWLIANLKGDAFQMEIWETHMRFTTERGEMLTKLIDGNFPDYHRVLPRQDEACTVLEIANGKAAALAISRSTSATREKIKTIMLVVKDGAVSAQGGNFEGVKTKATIQATATGADVELKINAAYLRDMIEVGEPMIAHLPEQDMTPIGFTWPGQPGRLGVLMPLRK